MVKLPITSDWDLELVHLWHFLWLHLCVMLFSASESFFNHIFVMYWYAQLFKAWGFQQQIVFPILFRITENMEEKKWHTINNYF